MKPIVLIVVVVLLVVFTGIVTAKTLDNNEAEYIEVIVQNGDTLWNIAKPYYEGNTDFRNFIHDICDINNIEQARIYPGQVILIPVS